MDEKEKLRLLWKERVKDYKVSGLSMKKYCEKQNLKVHQLQYWNQKYETDNKEESGWVSVNLNNNSINSNCQPVYLNVGVCRLEVKPGFDKTLLKELIKVLTEIC